MPDLHKHFKGRSTALAKVRLPSLFQRCLDHAQRRLNGGYKTYHTFISNLGNLLVGLPVELILLIAEFLSTAERVLLSLSSKRLRVILTNYFDLSLSDLDQRLGFLLVLEKDLPDDLTCRPCGKLFRWRLREHMNYTCPHNVGPEYIPHGSSSVYCYRASPHLTITREIIDLVARAYLRGSAHGLPTSCIDHTCSGMACIYPWWLREHFEARMIHSQIYLARSCTLIEHISRFQQQSHHGFRLPVCRHRNWSMEWNQASTDETWLSHLPHATETERCHSCMTDYRAVVLSFGADGMLKVMVYVWQNYGCQPDQREIPGIFDRDTWRDIFNDRQTLRPQDLEREFLASKEQTK